MEFLSRRLKAKLLFVFKGNSFNFLKHFDKSGPTGQRRNGSRFRLINQNRLGSLKKF